MQAMAAAALMAVVPGFGWVSGAIVALVALRKTLADAGDKVSDSEKESIEAAIMELEEALAGSDKDDIEAKTQKLTEASSEMAQKMYADQAEQAQQAGGEESAQSGSSDDAVDAEFEEVKDDKKHK